MPKESIYYLLPEMSGSHGPKDIKKTVGAIKGVISVSVNSGEKKVAVDFDNSGTSGEEITRLIAEKGFSPQILGNEEHVM